MRYTPHTDEDRREMLAAIGVADGDDLFHDVPEAHRFPDLDLPSGLSELEARRHFERMAGRNATLATHPCFLGAGAYHHYTPAVVPHLLFRGEIYTAYTPVPARGRAGHPPDHLRVPDDDRGADRHGCGERLDVRRLHRRGRGGADGGAGQPRAAQQAGHLERRSSRVLATCWRPTTTGSDIEEVYLDVDTATGDHRRSTRSARRWTRTRPRS